ncbi:SUMF1/EgtB/PvdO family nonheme iron enzyme [Magnetospirillum sp. SS-4]|uniref:formylglycine-generating enzyme family protein n=1 Tax=Magnetospirillum sp. SS-4 TaxID=2681465 RepID=UPI001571D927|nr:SUMF1/EgtB/PvdO family nonheme iron enzyme [Magnetospirillum sp. SS-4]
MRTLVLLLLLLLLPLSGAVLPAQAAEMLVPCPGCPPMAIVPAGDFIMGDARTAAKSEKPEVAVGIPRRFALGVTEVSFDQWQACADDGACRGGLDDHGWGRGERPAINMTWEEAAAFAAWVGRRSGLACRLPDEAEWEYAARAGTRTGFWWGDQTGDGNANCRDCSAAIDHPYGSVPVASYPPNPWGLHDMNGNVWEWTRSCWTATHAAPSGEDAATCRDRVIKGGSWYYFSTMSRASARARNDGRAWSYNIGLRVLCELP